jgi:hypothetical protein
MKPMCSTCRFFSPRYPTGFSEECHRHSPAPRLTFDGRHDDFGFGVWPAVLPDYWCGEFEPRVVFQQVGGPVTTGRL